MKSNTAKSALAAVSGMALLLGSVAPAAAQPAAVSQLMLSGVWTEDNACAGPEIFAFDGGSNARLGGAAVTYAITANDEVTFAGPGGTYPMQAQVVDGATMLVTMSGQSGPVYRCSPFQRSFGAVPASSMPAPSGSGSGGGGSAAGTIAALALIGGLAALAGSGKGSRSPAHASGPALTRNFVLGKWTESGNCSDAISFLNSGQYLHTNGVTGNWWLTGNALTVTIPGAANATMYLTPTSSNVMDQSDGTNTTTMVRC